MSDEDDYLERRGWWLPSATAFPRIGGTIGNVLDRHRPYVYRGTGVDQIQQAEWERAEKARTDAERWALETKKAAYRERKRRRVERQRQQEAQAQDLIDSIPSLLTLMYATIDQGLAAGPDPEPAHRAQVAKSGRVMPSPGWTPPTGGDLEAWLDETN